MPDMVLARPRKYSDSRMDTGELHVLGVGQVAVFSSRSPDKTGPNEDTVALIPIDDQTAVLAVADGVGGHPAGAKASALTIDLLVRRLGSPSMSRSEVRETILSAVEAANHSLLESGGGAATTCALVEVHGNQIRPYHVGDSAILVTGNRGKIKLETVSHSPTGYAIESGLLSEKEAIVHDERHLVSNVIGAPEMHISIGSVTSLAARDTLLIATDGLFDNLHKEEVVDRIRKGSLASCAELLVDLARRRMSGSGTLAKPDDMSFILFRPGKA